MIRFVLRNIETRRAYLPALVFLGCLALALASPAQDQNTEEMFGTNLSFEQGADNALPAGWNGDRNFFSFDSAGGRDGSAALRLDADGVVYPLATQKLDIAPGTAVEYTVYARVQGADDAGMKIAQAKIAIEWTSQGEYLGGSYSRVLTEEGEDTGSDWKKIGGKATVPPGGSRPLA